MADEVIGTILESFLDVECDSAWHGACLAVAEVARRGLLLPTRLVEVTPLVVRAMSYDVVRGQHRYQCIDVMQHPFKLDRLQCRSPCT
jgi:hypothetical protein